MSKYIRDTALGDCVRVLSANKFLKFPEQTENTAKNQRAYLSSAICQNDGIVDWYSPDDAEVLFHTRHRRRC